VTVCLTILSDGGELPPLVIFKDSTPTNPCSGGLVVGGNQNAWITGGVMNIWLGEIWHKSQPDGKKGPPILGHCTSHKCPPIKQGIPKGGLLGFVPGGCASLAQPLDVVVGKVFKDKIRALYGEWLKDFGLGGHNRAGGGDLKAPSSVTILRWIDTAWSQIDSELIIGAFKSTGNPIP